MNSPAGNAELILWRHAEAEDAIPGRTSDAGRALTARGQAQASRMGRWLNKQLPADLVVLVSPATRTLQTAAALGRPCIPDDRVGLSASVASILDACAWPAPGKITLVVGHQPTLGEIAGVLLHRPARELARGAIIWLRQTPGSQTVLHLAMKAEQVPEN